MAQINTAVIERAVSEPMESFIAIQYYLQAGKARTVHKAYQQYCTDKGYDFDKAELQMWITFADNYNWTERVQEKELELLKTENKYAADEQLNDLIKFRKRQSRLSIQLADTTELLLEKANQALLNLDPNTISPSTLPKYIEAAARISTLAQNAEAQVLALNDLIEHINSDDDSDEFDSNSDSEDFEFILT